MSQKIRRSISKARISLIQTFSADFMYIFFGLILIAGFVSGCIFSETSFDITPLRSGTFSDIFVSYLASLFIYQLILSISGFSVAGIVLIPLTVFFRGLGLGAAVLSLYSGLGAEATLWSIIILIPHFVLFAIYMIYSARLFFKLSAAMLMLVKNGDNFSEVKNLTSSTVKSCSILMCFMLAGALIYCFSILFMQTII